MPVTPSKSRVKPFAIRLSLKIMISLLPVFAFCLFVTTLRAQTLEIKLVNGQNGRPIVSRCIYVWVGDRSNPRSGPLLETETDKNGSAVLRLTREDAEVNTQSQRLACGLLGVINPVVRYGDTISIRAGEASCQPGAPNYSWLAKADFSIEDVLQHGIVTGNTCGVATASPKPGEVILFVRPLTWWEKLKQ
jgi:hypothetical protein